MLRLLSGTGILLSPLASRIRRVCAGTAKIILPPGTKRESLIHRNPASLDASHLQTTPLKDFGTMGLTDFEVDVAKWRFAVEGRVKTKLQLTYSEILSLPAVERKVLLICPGFFANQGLWQGVSMEHLLQRAVVGTAATHITFFSGAEGSYRREFPVADVLSNRVFLAYRVNGKRLPVSHGFPLRIVAEGYYGSDWIKYVTGMKVQTA